MPIMVAGMIVLATLGLWAPAAIILGHAGLVLMRVGAIYLTADLQHSVSDNVRATVGSLGEFFAYLVAIATALSVAALSYFFSGLLPFRYSAIVILLLTTLAWWLTRNSGEKTA